MEGRKAEDREQSNTERRRDMLRRKCSIKPKRIGKRKEWREAEDMALRILIGAAKALIAGIIGGLMLYGWLVWEYM